MYHGKENLIANKVSATDNQNHETYEVTINDKAVVFCITPDGVAYPKKAAFHKKLLWNRSEDERDITFALWQKFEAEGMLPDSASDPIATYLDYECYAQNRSTMAKPDPRLVQCFEVLERYHFLKTYTVTPDQPSKAWDQCCKSDGTMDLAVLKGPVYGNALFKEKLALILALTKGEAESKYSFLTDDHGNQYITTEKGQFGGHDKLGIYGRMDCPSAARYLKKGQYVQHRVFFKNEEVAIEAGYRPCGVCMKEAYKKWKKEHEKS